MKRTTALFAAIAAAVLTMGIIAGSASALTITEDAGSAGSVTFSTAGGVLAFVDADTSVGWEFDVVRDDGRHLKVVFTNGDGNETEFEAELEDGQVVVATAQQGPGGTITTTTTIIGGGATSTSLPGGDTTSTSLGDTSSTSLPGGSTTSTSLGGGDDGNRVRDRLGAFEGEVTLKVGPAGTVSIRGDGEGIDLIGVDTAVGWSWVEDRFDDGHIEGRFFGPDGVEIEFKAQFMGDHLDWRYEFEDDDDSSSSTSQPDDDDDDDDHRRRHGDDDDDDDDDHRGRGRGRGRGGDDD